MLKFLQTIRPRVTDPVVILVAALAGALGLVVFIMILALARAQ